MQVIYRLTDQSNKYQIAVYKSDYASAKCEK